MSLITKHKLENCQQAPEYGGALILTATLIAFVLVPIIALVVDSSMLASNKATMRHVLRAAALGGIEAYMDTSCEEAPISCKETAAFTKINEILEQDSSFNFLADPEAATDSSKAVKITFGRWIVQGDPALLASSPELTCPDTDGDSNPDFPCFKAVNANEASSAIRLTTTGNLRMALFFDKVFSGPGYSSPKIEITSAAVPRRTTFLVDISHSVTRASHTNPCFLNGTTGSIECPGQNGNLSAYLPTDQSPPGADDNPDWWKDLCPDPSNLVGCHPNPLKFKSDYIETKRITDADFTHLGSNFAENHFDPELDIDGYKPFKIDSMVQDPGGVYRIDVKTDPQPFNDIIKVLNDAVKAYRDRAVSGDKLSIIFYDDQIFWSRIVKFTDDFTYLDQLTRDDKANLDFTHAAVLDRIKGAYNGLPTNSWERRIRFGIYPRRYTNTYTDTVSAFGVALGLISQDQETSDVEAAYSIVHIGDGLANCVSQSTMAAKGLNLRCDDVLAYHLDAMTDWEFLTNKAVEYEVPFHMIQIGDYTRPHTIDHENPLKSGECLSAAEFESLKAAGRIAASQAFVQYLIPLGGNAELASYELMSSIAPYSYINQRIYDMTLETRGIWAPIKQYKAGCLAGDISDQCNPGQMDYLSCKPRDEQLQDYLDEIVGQNPYIIVRPE